MATMSLTEFNQNPSRAVRMADVDEVTVLRRGKPSYRLTKIPDEPATAKEKLEAMIAAGIVKPPRNRSGPKVWRHTGNLADWQEELDRDRNRFDYLLP